ncbi:MAG: single-stranded DNA-binding protein [Longimicrobiales bacterium]
MGRSVNKIILVGNVGRDPDLQTTAGGVKVAHVSLATSRRIPRNGKVEERTEWHRLTLWDRLAQIAEQHVRKGDRVYIEGRMEYDSYERNGVTVPTAEVNVRELVLLGSPRGNGRTAAAAGEELDEDGETDELEVETSAG